MLENYHGDDAMKAYQGRQFVIPEIDLKEYTVGIVNESYERFAFCQRRRGVDEAFDPIKKTGNFRVQIW